jgi:hypothetical protein
MEKYTCYYICDICGTEKFVYDSKCYYTDIDDNYYEYVYVCNECFNEKIDMKIGRLSAKQWLNMYKEKDNKVWVPVRSWNELNDYIKLLHKNKLSNFICNKCKKIYNAKFGIFIVDEMNLCAECYDQCK